ncbi:holin-like protein CidA [Collibacillus ludicampi]|uniref:Holin-like protein CidA n=1 Tax=Collibacillus ludicampi TaxID=2771369 RepID=A0AAV4LBV6_9BACL|nr:CidA/LrgA family holin-like protein [Collibacillus ludicampi]GIM45275.1 holin-like protein CidA [Collibacillus ludicampi]
MKTFVKGTVQVVFLIVFSLAGNFLAKILHVDIPGSILGLALLFLLLHFKLIRVEWVELGASWLLAEMLLFFIPPAVGIIQYTDLIARMGLGVVFVIIFSTLIVMICTGWFAELLYHRRKEKRHGRTLGNH